MSESSQNIVWKRQLRRSLEREQIARERAALQAIRRRIFELRLERVEHHRRLRRDARKHRQRIRAAARARRLGLRNHIAALQARIREARAQRAQLAPRVRVALQRVRRLFHRRATADLGAYTEARVELELERRRHAEALAVLRELQGQVRKARSTRAERRSESDDAVRANLPPDLADVFEVVKGQIKERAGRSRTEAFLEWVEAHPDDVWVIKQRRADKELRELVKAERHRGRKLIAAASDIPF